MDLMTVENIAFCDTEIAPLMARLRHGPGGPSDPKHADVAQDNSLHHDAPSLASLPQDESPQDELPQDITLCHGHYNVIHPGHQRFLQHAKSLGRSLLIAVHCDQYLQRVDPQKKYFSETERVNAIATLSFVDGVILLKDISLEELIERIKPQRFITGQEFETERAAELADVKAIAERVHCKMIYHSGSVSYANSLLHTNPLTDATQKRHQNFSQILHRLGIRKSNLISACQKFSSARMVVIGDCIVDQFIACDALGMSSEAPVLALKEMDSSEFIGGAAIVACHIRACGAASHYISVTGTDEPAGLATKILQTAGVSHHLIPDPSRPTTFKIRYMVEQQKILRVSRLEEINISGDIEDQVIHAVHEAMSGAQGVIISDFVYGLITPRVLDAIQTCAHGADIPIFADLQCSSQTGSILKFNNVALLTPTEREARIALADKDTSLERLAHSVMQKTQCQYLLITLGANGLVAYERGERSALTSIHFPALENSPIDVAGAGDALLSTVALAMATQTPCLQAVAIGVCAAAIAVSRMGNVPINQQELLRFIQALPN